VLLQIARAALALWPLEVVDLQPIKVRENAVYAVHLRDGRRVALRVHRFGYHSNAALSSELSWCEALAAEGIEVPTVIRSRAGRAFECIESTELGESRQVDVFEWIDGEQLGSAVAGVSGDEAAVVRCYRTIGRLAARMHNQAARWDLPSGFTRHAWDENGLVGEQPRWGRFWELDALSADQRGLLLEVRAAVNKGLRAFGQTADRYGLIHADLVPENVMVGDGGVRIIDFDDAGFGWHLFEIATSLYFIRGEPYFACARDAMVSGYREHRMLTDEHLRMLPLFMAARATTYLGWVHTRKGEPAAAELTPALMDMAVSAGREFLNIS
jgi:Ser/Thr protein kinase RdoA (MazF antagonist)